MAENAVQASEEFTLELRAALEQRVTPPKQLEGGEIRALQELSGSLLKVLKRARAGASARQIIEETDDDVLAEGLVRLGDTMRTADNPESTTEAVLTKLEALRDHERYHQESFEQLAARLKRMVDQMPRWRWGGSEFDLGEPDRQFDPQFAGDPGLARNLWDESENDPRPYPPVPGELLTDLCDLVMAIDIEKDEIKKDEDARDEDSASKRRGYLAYYEGKLAEFLDQFACGALTKLGRAWKASGRAA